MLTLFSNTRRSFCDGMARRNFLKIGSLGLGCGAMGLSLPQLLRAEQQQGRSSSKSIIMVYLPGGPPHQDMVDLKVNAPIEIRGEFRPIATKVPAFRSANTCRDWPSWLTS